MTTRGFDQCARKHVHQTQYKQIQCLLWREGIVNYEGSQISDVRGCHAHMFLPLLLAMRGRQRAQHRCACAPCLPASAPYPTPARSGPYTDPDDSACVTRRRKVPSTQHVAMRGPGRAAVTQTLTRRQGQRQHASEQGRSKPSGDCRANPQSTAQSAEPTFSQLHKSAEPTFNLMHALASAFYRLLMLPALPVPAGCQR